MLIDRCFKFCIRICKVKVLVTQVCLTLCDPMDYSPPGSSICGIFQAGILEWVAIPFSRGFSQSRDWTPVSCIAGRFFTIWTTSETVLEYRKLNAVRSEVLVSQLCSALCPMDCSPLGSSVHGILQARILKWVAIPFSRGFSQPRDRTQASRIAGRFLTGWATREVQFYIIISCILKHVIVYIITSSLFRNLRWFFFPI